MNAIIACTDIRDLNQLAVDVTREIIGKGTTFQADTGAGIDKRTDINKVRTFNEISTKQLFGDLVLPSLLIGIVHQPMRIDGIRLDPDFIEREVNPNRLADRLDARITVIKRTEFAL